MKTTELDTPLSAAEQKHLDKCEKTIERNMGGFFELGEALHDIRESRLYRNAHKTFEEYCKARWEFSRQRAYQLIDAAQTTANLSTIVDIPVANEAQARELARMEPEEAKKVLEEVAEEAGEAPITAAAIKEKRQLFEAADEPYVPLEDPPEEEEAPEPTVEEQMAESNKALESLAREITGIHKRAAELATPHVDEERLDILKSQLRTAAGTLRAAKGFATCSYCEGEGCKVCLKSGWLTKTQAESAPEKT